jgi:branched-chain amino acid transport system ATP-binding protein
MAAALELRGLSVSYGDLVAVWDASLTVEAGRTCAIVGRNGAGKTTMLSAVAGLLGARRGQIVLEGRDVTSMPPWLRADLGLALAAEGKRIFRSLSVHENLAVGAWTNSGPAQRRVAISDVYAIFPLLAERRRTLAGSLSGGQQQMLVIGQALASKPRVLLIDEPSAGLSPVAVHDVYEAIATLKQSALTIILVEQLVDEVRQVADDIAVMEGGKVIRYASIEGVSPDDIERFIMS